MSEEPSFDAQDDEILQSVLIAGDGESFYERKRAVELLRWCAERDIYWDDRIAIHAAWHNDHWSWSVRVRAGQAIGEGDLRAW
jgi:hypothetical protein